MREAWVVVYLKNRVEIWEEYPTEAAAQRCARSVGSQLIKVVRHRVMSESESSILKR